MSLLPTFAALLAGDPVLFNSSQPCEAAIIPRTGSGGLELAAIVDSIDEKGVHKVHTLVLELAAIVELIPVLLAGDPLLLV